MGFKDPMVYHTKLYNENGRDGAVTFDFIFFDVSKKFNSKNETTLVDYIEESHYRWNLFARGLYGDLGRHIFIASSMEDANITRVEAEKRREEGLNSDLYIVAKQRLESLAHISIFERMSDSIELLCWTFCWNKDEIPFTYKKPHVYLERDDLTQEEIEAFEKYHNIDVQLYKDALELFDKRFNEMKAQKEKGIMCNLQITCPVTIDTSFSLTVQEEMTPEITKYQVHQEIEPQESQINPTSLTMNEEWNVITNTREFPDNVDHIWQIAVPHTGTSMLENVLKAATSQDFNTRFYNNSIVSSGCDPSIFDQKFFISATEGSGFHGDWFLLNILFQDVAKVSRLEYKY